MHHNWFPSFSSVESTLDPDATPTPGFFLRMEDTPAPGPPPLAVIPIYYEDLEGLHHESTTLFADTTTTAGWVCLLVLLFSLSAINDH